MKYAQDATTRPRLVHSVRELQMALADKARGQRISQLRKRQHLTQQVMAERLGVAYRTYQGWEGGTMPEWPNLEKLANELKVKPEDIIGDEGPAASNGDGQSQLDRIEAKLDVTLELLRRLAAAQAKQDDPFGLLAVVAAAERLLGGGELPPSGEPPSGEAAKGS